MSMFKMTVFAIRNNRDILGHLEADTEGTLIRFMRRVKEAFENREYLEDVVEDLPPNSMRFVAIDGSATDIRFITVNGANMMFSGDNTVTGLFPIVTVLGHFLRAN
ncbi:hypothetical protein RNF90_000114 [Shigella flexneri]|nr:hypothetical protein [Shigella flexneri]